MSSAPTNGVTHISEPRAIRSFVRRQGKITVGQRRALASLADRFVIPFHHSPIALDQIFDSVMPVVLEIGFGMGETTAALAEHQKDRNFLGIEVYDAGVGALLQKAHALDLRNLKIVSHDAVDVVQQGLVPGCIDQIHVFFPDPWPKKRHHKRRLLQPGFVHELATRLRPGGKLHVATDWPDYAAQVLQTLEAEDLLKNTSPQGGFCPRPDSRPLTKFEQRGIRLGNPVADIIFERV